MLATLLDALGLPLDPIPPGVRGETVREGAPGRPHGTDTATLRRLVAYWADGYDWRVHEAAINALPSRFVDLEGDAAELPALRRRDPGRTCGVPEVGHVADQRWPTTSGSAA